MTAHSTDLRLALPITGMSCAACAGRVERALKAVPGVTSVAVNLATERAEVVGTAPPDALIGAVTGAGYAVAAPAQEVLIEGMTCASCVARVERALRSVPGVTGASVNLATESARVDGVADPAELLKAVRGAGYAARLSGPKAESQALRRDKEVRRLTRDVAVAGLLTLPVFVLEMGGHLVPAFHHWVMATLGNGASWLIQFVLTTLVLALPGRRFFLTGVPALVKGAPDMSSLVWRIGVKVRSMRRGTGRP